MNNSEFLTLLHDSVREQVDQAHINELLGNVRLEELSVPELVDLFPFLWDEFPVLRDWEAA